MTIRAPGANLVWAGATVPAWRRYRAALGNPEQAQLARLRRCLSANRHTEIGRELGFADIVNRTAAARTGAVGVVSRELVEAFRARVPLATYDDLRPWIRRIREGRPDVLTRGAVLRLTPSSGSTTGVKLLPFTAALRREFGLAVDAWIADLFLRMPSLLAGRAYWSISPALSPDRSGEVPVGFDDDSEYLGGLRGALARAVLAVPDAVCRVTDPDAFRYVTLVFLLRARDLRLISVWHPSFLSRLLEAVPGWIDRIATDVEAGTLTPPGPVPVAVLATLGRSLRADPARARELRRLSGAGPCGIWPRLGLISCWSDGAARSPADELRSTMPGVSLQPKGLVATEGIVSIPFRGRHPLAVRSHFFEFLDTGGRARLAHELQLGSEYSVVLTTGGGLYRYRLGDRIVVDGWVERTPSLRFVGRDDRVSDLFGEKLSDGFVASVLRTLFEGQPSPRFAMLAPDRRAEGICYTLFLESEHVSEGLQAALDGELRRNPHYAWCVDMRQLGPAQIAPVGPNAGRLYLDACVARGQRAGDVKPAALHFDTGWRQVLGGRGPER